MHGTKIAFFPYSSYGTDYIVTMQRLLQMEYDVVDYIHFKYGIWDIEDVGCIYLNWIEDYLDGNDRLLLNNAKDAGVRIVWVFHNKVSHDRKDDSKAITNISFLADISDKIVLHSKNSGKILASICNIDFTELKNKLNYIPHPNYIGDYKSFLYPDKTFFSNTDKFTFLFVGQMRPYKNLEILLNAFKTVKKSTNSRMVLAGRFTDTNYMKSIHDLCEGCEDIILWPYYISSLEMESVLEMADVMIMPYSLSSSLNSGSMIMAFSYKKSVIVPDICMADDYPDDMILKYHYENEKEHEQRLSEMMKKAYNLGTIEMKKRGNELYKLVERNNSDEIVKERLSDACFGL